jgi:hypothetical protein
MVRRSGAELNRGRLATPPHRAYGSVPRRFGGLGGKAVSMATKETAGASLRDAPMKRLVRADPPRSSRVYDGGESYPMRAVEATEFVDAPWSGRDIVSLLGALRHVAEHAVTSNGAYRPSLFPDTRYRRVSQTYTGISNIALIECLVRPGAARRT